MPVLAYIGLGSNLGDRRAALESALLRLQPRRVSTFHETDPWGRPDQPKFINAVAEIETERRPRDLLDHLLSVEQSLGRVRAERWGPRAIDLDLLLYDDLQVREEGLEVPHPRLPERRFVLEGLAELCPDRLVPGRDRTVRQILDALP